MSEDVVRLLHETAPPPFTVEEVVTTFERWLYLPDPRTVLVVLGAIAANRSEGDPVWLVVVGPPGGGKSETVMAPASLPDVHPTATLTEAALLSGTPRKEHATGAKGGLLKELGDFGIIVCKDFGSILNMHRDARSQVLAALREVYDGSWTRHVGTDGGKTLHWAGKCGLIAGCTPTIDRHHGVMSAMGERFVLFRLPEIERVEQARRTLAHEGREREMRTELANAVRGLFARELTRPPPLSEDETERLIALADLVTACRSAVERDGYTREIELIPGTEAPTRLAKNLARQLAGLSAIGVGRSHAWNIVVKCGLDSMPALRWQVFDVLRSSGASNTSEVSARTDHPVRTAERALEDLTAHKVVRKIPQGKGKANLWELRGWAAAAYTKATSPEMSVEVRSAGKSPNQAPFNSPLPMEEDISGEVERLAALSREYEREDE